MAPALAIESALLALSGAPRRQVVVVLTGFALVLTFFIWEARRGRRALVSEEGFFASLLATIAGVAVGVLGTGGLTSPMLPVLFAPAVVGVAAFGGARQDQARPQSNRWFVVCAIVWRGGCHGRDDGVARCEFDSWLRR